MCSLAEFRLLHLQRVTAHLVSGAEVAALLPNDEIDKAHPVGVACI